MTTTQIRPNEREAQIDGQLAELWSRASKIENSIDSAVLSLARASGAPTGYVRKRLVPLGTEAEVILTAEVVLADPDRADRFCLNGSWTSKDDITAALAKLDGLHVALAAVRADAAPLEAIYRDEQWSRFFLVINHDGHIHSSMHCSTCRPTTLFNWLPDLSGLTEADAVAAHGAVLCTVCYPSAPVHFTNAFELAAAEKAAEKKATQCPGSGTWDHDSSGLQYCSPRARCNHCGQTTSVTSTGKLRGHKPVTS